MKVFITGPDGVLGNNLVRLLLDRQYEVKVFIQTGKKAEQLEGLAIERCYGNILNADELKQAMQGSDIVIHAAAKTDIWPPRDKSYWDVNLEGTKIIIKAVKESGVKRLLHIGTANSFGAGDLSKPGNESNAYEAGKYKMDYMCTKYAAQKEVLREVRENDLNAVILNPSFMIGPYDSKPSSGAMILAVNSGKIPGYPGGGRNFVYVKDVATAIINAIDKAKAGECYILGNENLTYKEAFTKMAAALNVKVPGIKMPAFITLAYGWILSFTSKIFRFVPSVTYPMAKLSTEFHYYSSMKAVTELDMPQTPIEDALKEAVEWFRNNGYIKN